MTRARNQIISTSDTPYYHCIARCVRRAFLCGEDPITGHSFEHRRQWVIDRLAQLQRVFCIELCAYAVMSNHYHLVLCINDQSAAQLSMDDVIERWCQLYKGPLLVQRYRAGEALNTAERQYVSDTVEVWRQRLADISWFMRSLNEFIARQANQEDSCKGHFWESRFKSQALLDEKALLTCMAYVDLNPIRACIADTPESSDYTAVQARIQECTGSSDPQLILKPFDPRKDAVNSIAYGLQDYLDLVDFSGRAIREDKRGFIAATYPPILQRLGIDPDGWLELMRPKGIHISTVLGESALLQQYAVQHQRRVVNGAGLLRRILQ